MPEKQEQPEQKPEAEEPKVNKIFASVRSLPNGSIVKVEQSSTFNVRIAVGGNGQSDSMTLTPQTARALYAMLGGCLQSKS